MNNAKTTLVKNVISQLAGVQVDLSLRGEKSFTFHFEGENKTATQKIVSYFRTAKAQIEAVYDAEIDSTMIFVEA